METRVIHERYAEIGERLIDTEPALAYIRDSDVRIVYLSSDCAKKGSKVTETLGQCEKVQDKYKWGIPCDFTVTLFEPNIAGLTDKQIEIVIFHELLHVGIDEKGKCFSNPHDLEDFKVIVDRFGVDWARPGGSAEEAAWIQR